MEERDTTQRRPLVSQDRSATPKLVLHTFDLTRGRGQGNGLRIHGILFAVISVAVLARFMVLIATAGVRM